MLFRSPEDLLNPGIKPGSPALQADSLPSEPPGRAPCDLRDTAKVSLSSCKRLSPGSSISARSPRPAGVSQGRRGLVGCRLWGRTESDTTERFHFHFSLSCIGEGNGNPLKCSCLENPRDGGAWWAAVYGVTQSQTRLK